jgi:hypothetical protein
MALFRNSRGVVGIRHILGIVVLTLLLSSFHASVMGPISAIVFAQADTPQFPALSVGPNRGMAGDIVSLEGTGFIPRSVIVQITIGIAGQSNPTSMMPPGTVFVANPNGFWNFGSAQIPSDSIPGIYVIKATSLDAETAQATFEVLPQGPSFDVSLSTDSVTVVQAGDAGGAEIEMQVHPINGFANPLELTVANLPLGMNVAYSDTSGQVIMAASGKPDGNTLTGNPIIPPFSGNESLRIIIDFDVESGTPSGTYQVFFGARDPATGDSKARVAGVTVTTPTTPTLTFSPLTAQPGSSIKVMGSNFRPSDAVSIQFNGLNSGTNGFVVTPSSLVTAADGAFSAAFTVPSLAGGIYKVVAKGQSGQAISTFQVLPVLDTGTVQLQIAPKALVVPAGSNGNQTVTIVPIGKFSSDVRLTATPKAAGIADITFLHSNTLAITPGIPSPVEMELSLSSDAAPGSLIPIEVEAEVDGITITTEFTYVRIANTTGDFFISASPVDLVAVGGTTVSSNLILVTTNLSGSPVLSLSGLPAGITGEILNITPIDAAGLATATLNLSVPADAPHATSIFTLHGNFAGKTEKQLSMSISIVSAAPISVESAAVDPTAVTAIMPLYQAFPFGKDDGGGTIEIIVRSLATNTYGTTDIAYLVLPEVPEGEAVPANYSLLIATGGANMDSENPFVNADYDIRITAPGINSSGLSVGFLDTNLKPPIWTPLAASSTFNGDACGENSACATGVTHFSSWGLLAATAVAPPVSGGSRNHGGSHVNSTTGILEDEVPVETEIPVPAFFAPSETPSVLDEMPSQPTDGILDLGLEIPDAASDGLIPLIETTKEPDVFYADKWKIQPHVTRIDPLTRFFEPAARITIVFDIEPIASLQEGSAGVTSTVIGYDIVDEMQRVVFGGQFLLDEEITTLVHEEVSVTVPTNGAYSLVLAVHSESLDVSQRMEGITIAVPWFTAHLSVLVEVALIIGTGFVGYVAFRRSYPRQPTPSEKETVIVESTFDKIFSGIRFSVPTVIIAVVALMLIAAFFIIFAGEKTAQESAGMWVTNITASVAAIFAIINFAKKKSGPYAKTQLALMMGLVLWLGSRGVETWFNMLVPTLLAEEVLHHVYPGDFLLTFVTGHDLDVMNEALDGNFGWIYGLFTALKMGGFALFNFHLINASRLFADRYGKNLSLIAMIAPAIFLGMITTAYLNVLLGQILLPDLAIHFGYVILISMMIVPSTILLVVLRKDTKNELFWILSTLSLLSFVVAYSWQAFVPVGPNPEQYLTWLDQNVWLSVLLFGGDYLLMAFALLWALKNEKMEHREKLAHGQGHQA